MADNVIDTLSIEIVSEAQKAEDGLNRLIAGLGNLNTSLASVDSQGIKRFSSAMKKLTDTKNLTSLNSITSSLRQFVTDMNSIGQVSFNVDSLTTLIGSINKLGGVKATQATANLPQISRDLTSFINSINSLTAGGAGVENVAMLSNALTRLGGRSTTSTISNLPLLANALRDFFTTMSTAPEVSRNIIDMTTALANLAAQGGRVGSASRTISNGINGTLIPMRNARKEAFSLARAFGKLYANYFLIIRGIKALGNAFKSSADYLEAYNYFNVAFGKIADEWSQDFEKYGYENAESYAKSFSERMDVLFGKMSGQRVDVEAGMILDTGDKSLGLDIQKMTQYASNIAAVGNSMKMTGEATVATSKAMTMLAGDLSSLKNIELDEVMNNLQSGLIGQSRALYKYGIDITNATLQTYAYQLGLEKSVSEMTQGEKAQLRMIAILDQSKVAWGDLANTLNTPSNQLRMLKTNFANLSRAIGSLFIPVITRILPIINGVVIALQRLVSWIGAFFGIKINFDDFTQGYSDLGDGLEEIADGYEDATTAAKKFKAQLRGWDEVNNLTSNDDSNGNKPIKSGSLDLTKQMMDALAEYEKQWDDAFSKMENKALEWAKVIEKAFIPVKRIFEDFASGDFWKAGLDFSKLIISINKGISDLIKKVNWGKIGIKIGDFLAGIDWTGIFASIGELIWNAINAGLDLFSGIFVAAPLESTIIAAISILKFTGLGKIFASKISEALLEASTMNGLVKGSFVQNLSTMLTSDIGMVFKNAFASQDWKTIGFTTATSLMAAFTAAWVGFKVGLVIREITIGGKTVGEYVDDFVDSFVHGWQVIGNGIANWWNNSVAPWFTVERWVSLFSNAKQGLINGWNSFVEWFGNTGIVQWWNENVAPWFTLHKWKSLFDDALNGIKNAWTNFRLWFNSSILGFWNTVKSYFAPAKWNFTGIREGLTNSWNAAINSIKQIWNGFAIWLNSRLSFDIPAQYFMGKQIIPALHVDLGRIPTFYNGGFVPDSASFFMAGENGVPEMLGTVGGRTAVASGAEITGISDTIYSTSQQEMALMREEITLLRQLLNKPTLTSNQAFKAVQSEARAFTSRTNQPAF